MKADSKLAKKIESGDFIVTAEHLPGVTAAGSATEAALKAMGGQPVVVNMSDNSHGVAMSSVAASAVAVKSGVEPVLQMVTRDRNRIALQSDLLGAASLGIKNVLCLSGYHQTLLGYPESANVFDIDSIQLIATVKKMNEGSLLNGTKMDGIFSMLIGAVANPYLKPMELNILRLVKKVDAGAKFIQTQAVFDIDGFQQWLEAVMKKELSEKVAILAGVLPLSSAAEARKLSETYTDYAIPSSVLERMRSAGDASAQKKEGFAICVETVKKLKSMKGLRGVHILSGGKETVVPELMAAAAL
jgi:methylenetetrahydrofolate reductase (NADPH)